MLSEEQKKELLVLLEKEAKDIRKVLSGFAKKDKASPENYSAEFPKLDQVAGDIYDGTYSVEEYENRLALEHTLEARLKEVDGAILRLKKGNYGKCKKCKTEISFEKLKANPATQYCSDCIKNNLIKSS